MPVPGQLRNRIDVERNNPTKDSIGGNVENWTTVKTDVPADVRTVSSSAYLQHERAGATVSHRIFVRENSVDVQSEDRILWQGKTLDVHSVHTTTSDSRRSYTEIMAEEVSV